MRNTQNEKYTFVEAALPVIWFQVPLKKDEITACGDQPYHEYHEYHAYRAMAVIFAT